VGSYQAGGTVNNPPVLPYVATLALFSIEMDNYSLLVH
jgi:hypothetical protein